MGLRLLCVGDNHPGGRPNQLPDTTLGHGLEPKGIQCHDCCEVWLGAPVAAGEYRLVPLGHPHRPTALVRAAVGSCSRSAVITESWVPVDHITADLGEIMDSTYPSIKSKRLPDDEVDLLWKFKISDVDDSVGERGASADTSADSATPIRRGIHCPSSRKETTV